MLWLLVGLFLLVIVWIAFLAQQHWNASQDTAWAALEKDRERLADRLETCLSALCRTLPDAPSAPLVAGGENVWRLVEQGSSAQALEEAEIAIATAPKSADARVALAYALVANGEFRAASTQLSDAKERGQSSPTHSYLDALSELEEYHRGIDEAAGHAKSSMLVPVEVLALELHVRLGDAGDASGLWMPGQDGEISKDEARDFVVAHFTGYYRLIRSCLDLLEESTFVDGLYLLARLLIKSGFGEEGAGIMKRIEAPMDRSIYQREYKRDISLLRGEPTITEVIKDKGGQSEIRLKVLN